MMNFVKISKVLLILYFRRKLNFLVFSILFLRFGKKSVRDSFRDTYFTKQRNKGLWWHHYHVSALPNKFSTKGGILKKKKTSFIYRWRPTNVLNIGSWCKN